MIYKTKSSSETKKVAKMIARRYKNEGGIITLSGGLGTGKTTFVQGFCEEIGIKKRIISPTFILIKEYELPNSSRFLYHIDLYRLKTISSLDDIGLKDIINNQSNIVLIEWPEKIIDKISEKILNLEFVKTSKNSREIKTGN